MNNCAVVKDAIINKKQIHAYYNGKYRKLCPHVIGMKNGKQHGLFYQFGGNSTTGLDPIGSPKNWRCIPIDKLSRVNSVPGEWYTASNHSRKQSCVDRIDIEVNY